MFKHAAVMAILACALGAQAQVVSYSAQGVLRPLSGSFDASNMFFEVLGNGPDGPNSEYYAVEPLSGSSAEAVANYSASLGAMAINRHVQAEARFAYDLGAMPTTVLAPGAAYYPGLGLSISMNALAGGGGEVRKAMPTVIARNRSSARGVTISGNGEGYPPSPLPMGESLAFDDGAPPSFQVDLRELMVSAGCCSNLHESAPGPLPVLLQAPARYQPVYMGVDLLAFRDRNLPPVDGLPSTLDLADFNLARDIYVAFGGHYGLTMNAGDYASEADFQAAQSWIDANIGVVNFEVTAFYDITSLQAVPVPEPGSAALLAAGVLLLVVRRRYVSRA